MIHKCPFCGALMFDCESSGNYKRPQDEDDTLDRKYSECKQRITGETTKKMVIYSLCCDQGKVNIKPLKPPPKLIKNMMISREEHNVC